MSRVRNDKFRLLQAAVLHHLPIDGHDLVSALEFSLQTIVGFIDENPLVCLPEADIEREVFQFGHGHAGYFLG